MPAMVESVMDDSAIIRRVLAGEREAFAVLVRKYEVRVRGYCVNTLRDVGLAEDAAQEIFLKAFQGLERFRGDSAFSSWLYRISVNHCRDLLRKSARRKTESWERLIEEEGDKIEALLTTSAASPPTSEHAEVLHRVLALLPEACREVLLLREVQGLSYEELAAALGCSLDAVKGRLKRARQKVVERLRHLVGSGDV